MTQQTQAQSETQTWAQAQAQALEDAVGVPAEPVQTPEAVREAAEEIIAEAEAFAEENPTNIASQITEQTRAETFGEEQEISIADEIASAAQEQRAEVVAEQAENSETVSEQVAEQAQIAEEEAIIAAPEQQVVESGITPANI